MADGPEAHDISRTWWQQLSKYSFRARVQQMPLKDLELLAGEISSTLAEIQGQLAVHNPDAEWRERALMAQARAVARKQILNAEIQAHHGRRESSKAAARTRLATKARELARAGKCAEAIELLVDWIEGKAEGQS